MVDKRQAALTNLESLMGSIDDLVEALQVYRAECDNTHVLLTGGGSVSEAFHHAQGTNVRAVATEAVTTFERNRHRARLSLIDLGVEDGVTKAEFAANLGVSRQLADRWYREARTLGDSESVS